jgi:sulfite exporter TauE/SafE
MQTDRNVYQNSHSVNAVYSPPLRGMCGGSVALISVAPSLSSSIAAAGSGSAAVTGSSWRRVVLPQQLVFNAGRIASYTLLGANSLLLDPWGMPLVADLKRAQVVYKVPGLI